MTEQLERDLRLLFTEDADNAPTSVDLVEQVRHRARRRRSTRIAWGAGALVAASAVGVALLGGVGTPKAPSDNGPAASGPVAAQAPPSEETGGSGPSLESGGESAADAGALPGPAAAACKDSSPEAVAALTEVAFDGTVTDMGPARPSRPGSASEVVPTTLTVHEWFRGGSAGATTVDIPISGYMGPPPFDIGTRLLVSGMVRGDQPDGANVRAWYCGFTRYYDEATADGWRAAFG